MMMFQQMSVEQDDDFDYDNYKKMMKKKKKKSEEASENSEDRKDKLKNNKIDLKFKRKIK